MPSHFNFVTVEKTLEGILLDFLFQLGNSFLSDLPFSGLFKLFSVLCIENNSFLSLSYFISLHNM